MSENPDIYSNLNEKLEKLVNHGENVLSAKYLLLLDNLAYFRGFQLDKSYVNGLLKEYLMDIGKKGSDGNYRLYEDKLDEMQAQEFDAGYKTECSTSADGSRVPLPFGSSEKDLNEIYDAIMKSVDFANDNEADSSFHNISEFTIINTISERGLTGACYKDNSGNVYVIYRGTDGGLAWVDNFEAMLERDSAIQIRAYDFYKESLILAGNNIKEVVVSGHSKGGNLAQYVTVLSNYEESLAAQKYVSITERNKKDLYELVEKLLPGLPQETLSDAMNSLLDYDMSDFSESTLSNWRVI